MSVRSTRHRLAIATLWGMTAAGTANSAAACDALVVEQPSVLRLDYDAFASAPAAGRMNFSIESRSAERCAMDIALLGPDRLPLDETEVGDTGVRVRFNAGAGDTAMAATATPGIWRIQLDPGKRYRLSLEVVAIRDAVAEAGEHSQTLEMELRDSGAISSSHAGNPVTFKLVSPPRAQMNIAGAAGAFGQGAAVSRVDFGEMTANEARRVFLQVRANTISRLTIDSANRGFLKLENGSPAADSIGYYAILNGIEIDLRQHYDAMFDLPRTLAGSSLPFDLRLGEVGAHVAGTYSDLITIEFSPL
ncbi:hypothetical protein SAMN05428974_1053 [Sphingopyxis sp. YR583]|nr:hypothetical protein SAMN05428974_1053 [Sphingopyxis sp. YR583]